MKDYRLKVSIKNNRLLTAIENAGHGSLREFCEKYALPYSSVSSLVTMTKPAMNLDGIWSVPAQAVADALGVNPEALFNERQAAGFETTTTEREVDEPPSLTFEECEREALSSPGLSPEASAEQKELARLALEAMTPRQRDILSRRFGLGDEGGMQELHEVAEDYGVTASRIRQIEQRGLEAARKALGLVSIKSL